jgi:hypothetical protein
LKTVQSLIKPYEFFSKHEHEQQQTTTTTTKKLQVLNRSCSKKPAKLYPCVFCFDATVGDSKLYQAMRCKNDNLGTV